MRPVFPDVGARPVRKLKRMCVNKRHAQLSFGVYVEGLVVFFEFLLECARLSCRVWGVT